MENEYVDEDEREIWFLRTVEILFLLSMIVIAGAALKASFVYSGQVLIEEKAVLVEELEGMRDYNEFLYDVCRDNKWERGEDRSRCGDIIFEGERKGELNIKTSEI